MTKQSVKGLIFLILVAVAVFYILRHTAAEKKSRHVRNNMMKVEIGARSSDVIQLLQEPDTVYFQDSSMVFSYELGFLSADRLRIFFKNDTVFNRVSYD